MAEAGVERGVSGAGAPWAGLAGLYRLPPRIQALVDADLQQADVLAAWVSFAVAAFLGGLYLVSPRAIAAMTNFEVVPLAVGLFLLVALVRLRLAYRAPLGHAATALFIVLDFVLLYGLIWTFHIQYGQPPAFYLKAPTFLFAFLLIAVRALRFEPISLMGAGLCAALGWALMAAYARHFTPEPAVTRDFAAYLMGSVVLVGAEVEKIIALLLVTGVLTLAILRGRRQLVQAASGATATQDLSRFFAPEIARRITSDMTVLRPGFGEVRRAAILMADLRGFTALAARCPPAAVMGLLVDYQRRMGRVIGEHGGAIDKFLGDGILATFGCAKPSDTPAADALRALGALRAEAATFARDARALVGEPVRVGFAVAGGDVLCGTVGDPARLEFTVIGEAVNLAAKLEKANKELGTDAIVAAATWEEARREGYRDDAGEAKGSEAMTARVPGLAEPCPVIAWRSPS